MADKKQKRRGEGVFWYDALWKVLRAGLIIVAGLCIVFGVLFMGYRYVNENYIAPVQDEVAASSVQFEVARGNSVSTIAKNLEEAGLIRSKTSFKLYVELMDAGSRMKPGEYELSQDMTMAEILDRLTVGDGEAVEREITIVPGNTVDDIIKYLEAEGAITDAAAVREMCRTGAAFKSDYESIELAAGASNSNQRKYMLEGYLAPDTYRVYTDATAESILGKLLTQADIVFNGDYYTRAEELEMTMDEVLTLASIIEKEAKNQDFKKVSAVFHNRLDEGMRLESCATVQYVIGISRLALTNSDMSVESGYNTYKNKGLPVGPICNPSRAAIEAALYPDEEFKDEGYLYFCSKDPKSGELDFSKKLSEHEEKSELYRPLWIASDVERGVAATTLDNLETEEPND